MRSIFRKSAIFGISTLSILIVFPLFLLSEEVRLEDKWMQEGNILLGSEQFEEAELLANSILESDPSNSKAEFMLTQSWIGLGREERKRGNFSKAKEYLQKAYEKWPLNESIRNELAELEKPILSYKRSSSQFRNNSITTNASGKGIEDLTLSMDLLRIEIEKLKIELEMERKERSKENLNENNFYLVYLLLGVQIAVLFRIFRKIR
ncbi:tetratricopeptide repeat protein [Leptospira licerasiae]|uniref:tetratricopeptide repeat protein n=1 Tax=Leptospira licerasiae TaxID=447106 RepID=UPI00301ABD39